MSREDRRSFEHQIDRDMADDEQHAIDMAFDVTDREHLGGSYGSPGPKIKSSRPLPPPQESGAPKPTPITSVHARPGNGWDKARPS